MRSIPAASITANSSASCKWSTKVDKDCMFFFSLLITSIENLWEDEYTKNYLHFVYGFAKVRAPNSDEQSVEHRIMSCRTLVWAVSESDCCTQETISWGNPSGLLWYIDFINSDSEPLHFHSAASMFASVSRQTQFGLCGMLEDKQWLQQYLEGIKTGIVLL